MVPGGLSIVVGVHVNPARRDERPTGVELSPSAASNNIPHGGDLPSAHRQVASAQWRASAVGDERIPDHHVVVAHSAILRSDFFGRTPQ